MKLSGRLAGVLLLLLTMTGCGKTAPEDAVVPTAASAIETSAADITLTVTDEHGFADTIASLEGNVVLVDFWASWCPPCRAGFPHTVELYEEFHDRGLEVVSVSFDEADAHDAALAFLKENRAVFTNLRSTHGYYSDGPFETEGALPVLRVYDAQGELIKAFASGDPTGPPFTPDDVRRAVEQAIEAHQKAPVNGAVETAGDG